MRVGLWRVESDCTVVRIVDEACINTCCRDPSGRHKNMFRHVRPERILPCQGGARGRNQIYAGSGVVRRRGTPLLELPEGLIPRREERKLEHPVQRRDVGRHLVGNLAAARLPGRERLPLP